jgi:hypothetical protein
VISSGLEFPYCHSGRPLVGNFRYSDRTWL